MLPVLTLYILELKVRFLSDGNLDLSSPDLGGVMGLSIRAVATIGKPISKLKSIYENSLTSLSLQISFKWF